MDKKLAFSSFALVFLLAAAPLRAQYSSSWWGVRAGVNLANESVTLPDNTTANFNAGLIAGLAYEHWFDDTWGLDVSLLFDQKGVQEAYSGSAVNRQIPVGTDSTNLFAGNDNFNLSYLELPIVIKYSFGEGDIKPYIDAGPTFGFLVGASESTSATSNAKGIIAPVGPPQLPALKSELNSLDMGVYVGLGITDELYNGPMLLFDAGYSFGLTKIYKNVPTTNYTDPNHPSSPAQVEPLRYATDGTVFPYPVDPTNAKSGDLRIVIGAMWRL